MAPFFYHGRQLEAKFTELTPFFRPLVAHHCNVKVIGGCKRQNDTQHSAERGEEVLRAKKNLGEPGGAASETWCFELGEDIQQTSVF